MQDLKAKKIVWPFGDETNPIEEIFIISVDSVHCKIQEVRAQLSVKWCSTKHNSAGLVYELALSVYDSILVWMNGPFQAATHDVTVFRNPGGLKSMMPPGKRGIGDRGYTGEPEYLSTRGSE